MDLQEHFEKYVLHEHLNEGGMAEVFLATDPDGNQVTIRRLLPKYKFNLLKRKEFAHGLKIQTQLKHPNIVQIIDHISLKMIPYAAMEYVDGMSLREAIFKWDDLILNPYSVFEQILKGLQYIHASGYLHLD